MTAGAAGMGYSVSIRNRHTLGIFGGSFDPPHMAHVFVAAYALSAGEVDALCVVPTFHHAFGKHLTSFDHRYAMTALAMAPLRDVEVSKVEKDLGGVSYMIRTLEALQTQYPNSAFRLVVGADVMAQLPNWKESQRVIEIAPPLLVGRHGVEAENVAPFDLPPITSAGLRHRLSLGSNVDRLIPHRVLDYIKANSLYAKD